MKYTEHFGISCAKAGWVPAPSYILRRAVILNIISQYQKGCVLEVGCGSGALLYDLAQLGFQGVGVEHSEQARALAKRILRGVEAIQVSDTLPRERVGTFDYLLSFEVLEHIEDDQNALSSWVTYLRDGGTMILSVPAHQKMWSDSDIWAGHFRRYERHELTSKIEASGMSVMGCFCCGWPLSNIISPIRSLVHGRKLRRETMERNDVTSSKRTFRSGIERTVETRLYPLYANRVGQAVMAFFIGLQKRSLLTDRGTGYIVVARKR